MDMCSHGHDAMVTVAVDGFRRDSARMEGRSMLSGEPGVRADPGRLDDEPAVGVHGRAGDGVASAFMVAPVTVSPGPTSNGTDSPVGMKTSTARRRGRPCGRPLAVRTDERTGVRVGEKAVPHP
ncbi:hypothetical protein ACFU6H_25540 [Streptomyces phaeoluteigriseus]|uniref:hypothetical protein n=1 Tax=Streptomyces phaeoluteigriseus TaxID=114686 RepID=UPI0036CC1221